MRLKCPSIRSHNDKTDGTQMQIVLSEIQKAGMKRPVFHMNLFTTLVAHRTGFKRDYLRKFG